MAGNAKVLLFLYPIKAYLDHLLRDNQGWMTRTGSSVTNMNFLIDGRYRQQGYAIYWLLFGREDDVRMPDRAELKADVIDVRAEDSLISCGIAYAEHRKHRIYPDSGYIFGQLPENMERLVLGGYHNGDCVDRLAAAWYGKIPELRVDEDITDDFFPRTYFGGKIPLVRPRPLTLRDIEVEDRYTIDMMTAYRKERPWLEPIL